MKKDLSASLRIALLFILCLPFSIPASGKDFQITGRITTVSGNLVPGAKVSMIAGTREFSAVSGTDGYYSLRISGIYTDIAGVLETGNPFPNPFSYSVRIPFIISAQGDVRFSVYSMSGQKISETFFRSVTAGSYNISWDGRSNGRSPVPQGLYIYAITFRGETKSGRLIKLSGNQTASAGTSLETVMMPPVNYVPGDRQIKVRVITNVSCDNYYTVRLTDIVIRRDTIIDFEIDEYSSLPFKTSGNHIARLSGSEYKKLVLKGINFGSSPPGTFPGEIAYAISGGNYEEWINRIGEAGFNCIRVYTLHPPVFYEKLANYNYRHPEKPLLLFQGIWLGEMASREPSEYDLMLRKPSFINELHEVLDCIHGEKSIGFRYGRAYGDYPTDISRWTAGLIIGREISPQEVDSTNRINSSVTSYQGSRFSISGASASEVFATQLLDEAARYENEKYSSGRPLSISSWPTLDPLDHPTEIHTDEDKASIDIYKIAGKNNSGGIFATYHAYPYYPNFISQQPSYLTYSDSQGPNSYLGYLNSLKDHYSEIPLVIGEFGVPSSWGSAHWSYSNMEHGGYSERQQGEKNVRQMHNIIDAGCAGGFMFAWMDEWFKPTWIVQYLEAYGFNPGTGLIPTRQLWHNLTSPEQNFGLLAFEQTDVLPKIAFQGDFSSGTVSKISATHDNEFFHVDVEFRETMHTGDTVMIAFDTYSASTGESRLTNGKSVANRAEFLLMAVAGEDSAKHFVTEAYNMNGLTPRFNMTTPQQKFRSTISDGAPWKLMEWINDGAELTTSRIGLLPMVKSGDFPGGGRHAVAWEGTGMKIRIPWTMLYFHDPVRMEVIDGAESYDGGWNWSVFTRKSDGIGISVYSRGNVASTSTRYNWDTWLIVPPTKVREKESLQLVETGLSSLPDFAN